MRLANRDQDRIDIEHLRMRLGDAFEGVKECYAAHRGNTVIAMDDFQRLVMDVDSDNLALESSQAVPLAAWAPGQSLPPVSLA